MEKLRAYIDDQIQVTKNTCRDPVIAAVILMMLGMRAVLLTMIIPTILIIAITIILSYLEVGTLAQILIALGVAAAYMLLLWLLRDRFERTFAFTVRKK